MNPDEHDYLVLGDLRATVDGFGGPRLERGRFIVRMFVGDQVFDEEIESSLDELHDTVHARMLELERKPDPDLLAEAERPRIHPGHAVMLP